MSNCDVVKLIRIRRQLFELIDDSNFQEFKNFVNTKMSELNILRRRGGIQILKLALIKKGNPSCYAYLYNCGFLLEDCNKNPFDVLTMEEAENIANKINKLFVSFDRYLANPEVHSPLNRQLISKSFLIPRYDKSLRTKDVEMISRMFSNLAKSPARRKIMEIIADCSEVKIYFDLYQDYLNYMQPTLPKVYGASDPANNKIYVCCCRGQGKHFDLALIIHEFLHYCLHLVYGNSGLPYKIDDACQETEFLKIFDICKAIYNLNQSVFIEFQFFDMLADDSMSASAALSELIVMPVSLEVELKKTKSVLKLYKENFYELYEFFEDVLKDIQSYAEKGKASLTQEKESTDN